MNEPFIFCKSITTLEGNHKDSEQFYANVFISHRKNFITVGCTNWNTRDFDVHHLAHD